MKRLILTILLCTVSQAATAYDRVVVAGGSVTDILYALGLQDKIVAVDVTSYYPKAANNLPKIGYFRQLNAEGILKFRPDLLIGFRAMGPDNVLAQVKAAGIPVKRLAPDHTTEGLFQMIHELGEIFQKQDQAKALIQNLKRQLAQIKPSKQKRKAMFLMGTTDRSLTVTGGNTVPQTLFNLVGIENIFHDIQGTKPVPNELVVKRQPDMIIVPDHSINQNTDIRTICQAPALAATPAGKNCKVLVIDSLMTLGLGTRLSEAAMQIHSFATTQ